MSSQEYDESEEIIHAISSLIAFVLVLILTCAHSYAMYSDFFTEERAVLNYRRSKPKITHAYKRMAYLTYACIISVFVILLAEIIQYNFTVGTCASMFVAQIFTRIGYLGAKITLYLVFILRLHDIYGTSAYGYDENVLRCIAITVVIVCLGIFALVVATTSIAPVYHDDTDKEFPFYCQILINKPYIYIVVIIVSLFDLVACISSIVFFIRPLNKVVKACQANESAKSGPINEAHNKRLHKMVYTGYKYKVLVMVAGFSTLLWLVLVGAGMSVIGTFFLQMDYFINPLCLALMTTYYPSDKYYERLCYLCICCCDHKRKSYKSHA
eukprot:351104_1